MNRYHFGLPSRLAPSAFGCDPKFPRGSTIPEIRDRLTCSTRRYSELRDESGNNAQQNDELVRQKTR